MSKKYRSVLIDETTAKRVEESYKDRVGTSFAGNVEYLIRKALGDDVR